MEKETKKELIKKFREQVAGGKYATRTTLLAYAFLREKPYVALEKKINEDHESFGAGRVCFLNWLSQSVAFSICETQYSGKRSWDFRKEGNEEKGREVDEFKKSLGTEIYAWIQEKYISRAKEDAA